MSMSAIPGYISERVIEDCAAPHPHLKWDIGWDWMAPPVRCTLAPGHRGKHLVRTGPATAPCRVVEVVQEGKALVHEW